MASSRDIFAASQTIRRNVQDLEIGEDSRTALEATMVANAAAGRVNEAAIIMQMLGRTSKELAMDEILKSLKDVTAAINKPEPVTEQIDYDKLAVAINKRKHTK